MKSFNTTGSCFPAVHYMVNIDEKLKEIKSLVDNGNYFVINRPRQYGKTTTLHLLADYLRDSYIVISLDFQGLSSAKFKNEYVFSSAFAMDLIRTVKNRRSPIDGLKEEVLDKLREEADGEGESFGLVELFLYLSELCETAAKSVVLLIDEVDSASNNQVFLDFLAQLRNYYLKRYSTPAFWSVILAGVYDIKNLKLKIRADSEHRYNSPWNVAADYLVDMSFSAKDIAGMLLEYESDHATGMDIDKIAGFIYEYTSGYPFLVSRICKLIDEQIAGTDAFRDKSSAWTPEGVVEAVSLILSEKNMLFESLQDKVESYPELKELLYTLLMNGKEISYNPDNEAIDIAMMFGFLKVENKKVAVANRIFETRLYNMFLTAPEMQASKMYTLGDREKYEFIKDGKLNMERILERFVVCFDELYGDQSNQFLEEDGRRYFLLYLRPIINGTGNYYIESRTRNQERTDVIVDYCGEQYVIEMKIWHGNAYNMRGENQLTEYLEHYHLDKGYMLSFNFNKKKEIGVKQIQLGDKVLVEAVV